ncbi:hypothetical protein BMR85_007585 [Achromobacter sp. KAs 3-5]|nr:hypothetical protein BMR85_007585 [Achromobacter sp. KAs 3-5]
MDFYEIETAFGGIREGGCEVTRRRSACAISKFRAAEISVYCWLRKLGQFGAVAVDNEASAKRNGISAPPVMLHCDSRRRRSKKIKELP